MLFKVIKDDLKNRYVVFYAGKILFHTNKLTSALNFIARYLACNFPDEAEIKINVLQ